MEYISYLAVAVVAFWIGGHWKAYQIMQNLISRPDDMIKLITKLKELNDEVEADNTLPDDAVELTLENVGDQVYAYNKSTGQFLAQAGSVYQVAILAAKQCGKTVWHPDLKQDSQTA
jgi:hypothetical protein